MPIPSRVIAALATNSDDCRRTLLAAASDSIPVISPTISGEAPIEDQFRVCREYAERQGWRVVESALGQRALSFSTLAAN